MAPPPRPRGTPPLPPPGAMDVPPLMPFDSRPFDVVPVFDFDEVPEVSDVYPIVQQQRPPPLPRPGSRRGLQSHSADEFPGCAQGGPGYGETAGRVALPSNPKAVSWTGQLLEMREWEVRWAEIVAEADAVNAECDEEAMKPQSMSASLHTDLCAELDQTNADAEKWSDGLWDGLTRIRKRVASLGHNANRANVAQVRPLARGIEKELAAFKAQQRIQFDALATAEFSLSEVLPVLGRRYEGWVAEPSALFRPQEAGAAGDSSGSRSRGNSRSPRNSSVPPSPMAEDPEVVELRTALESIEAEVLAAGGLSGGWTDYNHEVFIRVLRMFKNEATPAFYKRVEERLPDVSKSDMADHARWAVEHENRQETKRRLLARWRARRYELEREVVDAKGKLEAGEAEQLRQASEREQRQKAETKRKLAEWKAGKAYEEESLAEQLRREDDAKVRLEREQRKQQAQQREVVDAYRRKRDAEHCAQMELEQAATSSRAARRAVSQDDKQRIAKRNGEVLLRKLQAQGGPSPRAHFSARAPSPMSSRVLRGYEHIESRLYDTTESSISKIKAAPSGAEDAEWSGEAQPGWRGCLRADSVPAPGLRASSAGPRPIAPRFAS